MPPQPRDISPEGLDRDDLTGTSDRAGHEERIEADVCADVEHGGTRPARSLNRELLLELVAAQPTPVIGRSNTPPEPTVRTGQNGYDRGLGNRRQWSAQQPAQYRALLDR